MLGAMVRKVSGKTRVQLRELEIGGAELFQKLDGAIGFRLAHLQVFWAELQPGFGAPPVQSLLAEAAQSFRLRGRAAASNQAECKVLPKGYSQFEQCGIASRRIGSQLFGHNHLFHDTTCVAGKQYLD